MLYTAQANHDGLQAGIVYDLDDEDIAFRADAIEAGFLTANGWAGSSALEWPEPEMLSTVGHAEPRESVDLAADESDAE